MNGITKRIQTESVKELLEFLPKLRGKRIGVYGDLIADEYVFGTIHRFSREAPVFIVNYEESQTGLGGAANAVHNIQALGGIPFPFGVLGNDPAGRTLFTIMREKGVPTDGIIVNNDHPTFVKQRIVAGSPHSVKQQILRLDRCLILDENAQCHHFLLQRASELMSQLDAMIISDYGLGVAQPARLQPLIEELERRNIPVFVDSRHQLSLYRGMTAATPNEPEVEAIIVRQLEDAQLPETGLELLSKLEAKALVITRGKKGMALFTRDDGFVSVPIFGTTEIVDVTGAGDTVISTFALAVSAGASFLNAVRLANCAAGISVMKRGAATVSQDELGESIRVAIMHGAK